MLLFSFNVSCYVFNADRVMFAMLLTCLVKFSALLTCLAVFLMPLQCFVAFSALFIGHDPLDEKCSQ